MMHFEKMRQLAICGSTSIATEKFPTVRHGADEIRGTDFDAVVEGLKKKKPFQFLHKTGDSKVGQFEQIFQKYMRTKYTLAVNGDITAMIFTLVGWKVGCADEVILPGCTDIASATVILTTRAMPLIAKIDSFSFHHPANIEHKTTLQTRAIIRPVHMRETSSRTDEIMTIVRKYNLKIFENNIQANGGFYPEKKSGCIGDAGAVSLQYFKITTSGEGGMMKIVYEGTTMRHDSSIIFGERDMFKSIQSLVGGNYRMNEIQGASGLIPFERIDNISSQLHLRKKQIMAEIQSFDSIELQNICNPTDNWSARICIFLQNVKMTKDYSDALKPEGIPNGSIFDKRIPDQHIFCYRDYMMNKTTADPNGSPNYKGQVNYFREQCSQTLDYLNRTIATPLSQSMKTQHANISYIY